MCPGRQADDPLIRRGTVKQWLNRFHRGRYPHQRPGVAPMAEVRAPVRRHSMTGVCQPGASGITELAAPETQRRRCAGQLLRGRFRPGDGHLHCQHDAGACAPIRGVPVWRRGRRPGVRAFLCALLRGLADAYGKAALARPPVRRRRRSDPYRDRQAVACPACSGACASRAPWFDDWISQDNLGDPGRLMAALFPPWPAP